MGLFDIFKKKDCEICGKEVGMLGYKKLQDGEICNACAKQLSPWFEDRKGSTVAQIQAQLDYRRRNAEELKNFQPTRVYGDYEYMFVEERDGVPFRFCVSRSKDYLKENADLVLFENVQEVIIDIDDNANEQQNENSDEVTYDLSYKFRVSLMIRDVPWFDNINFELNSADVEVFGVYTRYEDCVTAADFKLYEEVYPAFVANYRKYKNMCEEIQAMCR